MTPLAPSRRESMVPTATAPEQARAKRQRREQRRARGLYLTGLTGLLYTLQWGLALLAGLVGVATIHYPGLGALWLASYVVVAMAVLLIRRRGGASSTRLAEVFWLQVFCNLLLGFGGMVILNEVRPIGLMLSTVTGTFLLWSAHPREFLAWVASTAVAFLAAAWVGGSFLGQETSLVVDMVWVVAYVPATLTMVAVAQMHQDHRVELDQARQEALAHSKEADRARAEVEKQADQLEKQAELIADAAREKTLFFQSVSHELRTPLTLILGSLEPLRRAHPDDQELAQASRSAHRLYRLVNQLLDFQKIVSGKRRVDLTPTDLSAFLEVCQEQFEPLARQKNLLFRVRRYAGSGGGIDDPVYILGDLDALEKVVFNFLSNAFKFTPEGGFVELGLQADGLSARIEVRDSGPGIALDQQEALFQVFSQVGDTRAGGVPGSGLGLALARRLAEAMNGIVGVDSEFGEGATFWTEFPQWHGEVDESPRDEVMNAWMTAEVSSSLGIDVAALEETSDEPEGDWVLVVDDHPDLRRLIATLLRRDGYFVRTSVDGEAAWEEITTHRPALVIADWMMPRLDGPGLIRRMRENPHTGSIPTVLLTARTDDESKLSSALAGADVFMGKPFAEEELLSTVRNLLRLKAREKEVEALNRRLADTVLTRYLPPALVERVMAGELTLDESHERTTATVLFADLCGFTATTEALGGSMVEMLDEYLTAMTEVLFAHEGTIDKFMGDGVMALFGAPVSADLEDQVRRAAAAAWAMQRRMHRLNESWRSQGLPNLDLRVGLHIGPVAVGHFGGPLRSDYTAVGHTVNVASRIETACRPGEVWVSGAVAELLPDCATQGVGHVELKGVRDPLELFRLVEHETEAVEPAEVAG